VVALLVSIVFIVDDMLVGGRGGDTMDDTEGGGGGGGAGDRGVDSLLFSVNCTGNTRVVGIGVSRFTDSVITGVVFVVVEDDEALVVHDG
jgi:hypothetical protein